MDAVKLDFIQNKFVPLLNNLHPTAMGNWGKMNAQQMVEHLIIVFKMSIGKIKVPLVTPDEDLPKFKAFLFSDAAFRENTKAPSVILGDEPLSLHHNNISEAIVALQKSIDEFVSYFKEDENKTTIQPVFGHLNFKEWILFHYKHLLHHGKQFGLFV